MKKPTSERNATVEIDLVKLLGEFFRYWWLIGLAAAIVAAGTLIYTNRYVTPMYRANISVYVNNYRNGQQVDTFSNTGLTMSETLVSTYMEITKSKQVLKAVSEELGGNYSVADLRTMISTSPVTSTSMFYIFVSNSDPVNAATIANAIGTVVPQQISSIVEGSSAFVIDYAEAPNAPYTPNKLRNAVLGALAGAVIVMLILALRVIFDIRVWDSEDLNQVAQEELGTELPILAQIPDFNYDIAQKSVAGYAQNSKMGA